MDQPQKQESAEPKGIEAEGGKRSFWKRRPVVVIGTAILFGLLYFGLTYLAQSLTHESTDDAFLDAHVAAVAPKVAGRVRDVPVKDNQVVKTGALLVDIEPRDFQVLVEQKRAALGVARGNLEVLKSNLALRNAQVDTAFAATKQSGAEAGAAEATSKKAESDFKRAEDLVQKRTISPQEYDSAKAAAEAAEANLKAARERTSSDQSKVAEAKAQLETARKAVDWGDAQIRQSEADLDAAELNLSYCRVIAPIDGRITRKAVTTGDYVQIGQKLMALVPDELFVTANYKETELTSIRPGQKVRITIDSMGGRSYAGHVDSIMAGSGAAFSLLPPENAVGNFVKVVQRIPVKIVFDEPLKAEHVLGPGMSVEPSVHVTSYVIPEAAVIIGAAVCALVVGVLWWRAAGRRRVHA
jgi:membrane fusion protein, multidrug efflux system